MATVFFEEALPPDLSETVADEIGAEIALLGALEFPPASAVGEGEDYLSVMRQRRSDRGGPVVPLIGGGGGGRVGPAGGNRATQLDPTAVARVKDWTRHTVGVEDDIGVMVKQLACTEPGCPPVETVIASCTTPGRSAGPCTPRSPTDRDRRPHRLHPCRRCP